MSDTAIPGSVATRGNLLLLWVPENGLADQDHPTKAELTATTVKELTYSLTPSGYNRTPNETVERDERLTLPDVLETPGEVTHAQELQYVHGASNDVADVVLKRGAKGYLVERRAVPHAQPIDDGDIVDVVPVTVGYPRKDPPSSSGTGAKFTKTVKLFTRGRVSDDAVVGSTAG